MAETVRQQSSAPELPPEEDDVSPLTLVKRIYAFFYNKTVGLILIILMAVLALFGTMIMQAPTGTFDDPIQAESFLESVRPKYGMWTDVLAFLGFFRMYTSPIFLTVSALLAGSIIGCTVHRLPLLWRAAMHPRTHVSQGFHRHAQNRRLVTSEEEPDAFLQRSKDVFKKNRWRILADDRDPRAYYTDKNRFGPFGTALAHAAFVLIMAAFVVSSLFSFEQFMVIPVGGSVELEDSSVEVRADSFVDSYNEDGRPIDYVSELTIVDNGTDMVSQEVRVNMPLAYGGVKFHQTSYGIASNVHVTELDGNVVFDGAVPMQWTSTDGTNSVGSIDEREDLDILIVTPASGRTDSVIPIGSAMVEIYPSGSNEPLAVTQLPQGEAVTVGDFVFTFEGEAQYTGITARHDPGSPLLWIASILLVVGMFMTFGFPHRRIWVRVDDDSNLSLASVDKHDAIYANQFNRLIGEIEQNPERTTDA
ncbi:cytochrome C biosynthesis protein [Flaviflexus ciconiae]|uniref:Cytochrome C biosynthesis protein n=1 Tax=Flaviflexus ciconiae TaxID=2496867 RepID=A0A3S9PV91_9ACTO|nr:cytochrome c biogenesis protein ResB [Flaviflexus ciconiae]AZQ76259.1 cytochrome C biosynthesis protein [Flaviflexus ciconiae]